MSSEAGTPSRLRAEWLDDPALRLVLGALDGEKGSSRIVGGAVRNWLIGEPVSDIDIATALQPNDVMRRATAAGLKPVPTGLSHGTVTVVSKGRPYEVTTLRHDVETDGRRAKVAFTDDWAADASRRDFTINALYLNMDGTLFDPLGGLADIEGRRVRFIGDAAQRIAEDYLRILRFFRFSARLSPNALDPEGLSACVRGRAGLTGLSAERVNQEMHKLMMAAHPGHALEVLCDTGLFSIIMAGVPWLWRFERFLQIEQSTAVAPDPLRRLAALSCVVEEDADRLAVRLRLSRAEHRRLRGSIAGYRDVRPFMSARDAKAGIYKAGPETWRDRVALAWSAAPATNDERWKTLFDLPDHWQAPAMPWDGAGLAGHGFEQGPGMGRMLKLLEKLWIEADFPEDEAERAAILEDALQQFAD